MKKWILAAVAMMAMVCVPVSRAAEPEKEKQRTISCNGESVVYVSPDEVVISFGVRTTDPKLDKARADNDERGTNLVKALKEIGIEEKYIQTNDMNVTIVYTPSNRMNVEGYQTTRSYAVRVKDIKKFEKVVDTGLKNGANVFDGFDYISSELRKYRDQARTMAIKAAKEKATDLAAVLDCKVGAPVTITESSSGSYSSPRSILGANSFQNAEQVVGGGGGGEVMPLGQIAIRANVSVTFDLLPPK